MSEMVEQVSAAIDAMQLFSRFNDWTRDRVHGVPIEICRYGGRGEIVVMGRFPAEYGEDKALAHMVSSCRATAAIRAVCDPSEETVERVSAALRDNIEAGLPDGVVVDYHYAARAAIAALGVKP